MQVRLLLLAALSQEHVLYIGPPGTAKSEIGRRLSRLIKGNYFERLLTRFSVPEVRGRRHYCSLHQLACGLIPVAWHAVMIAACSMLRTPLLTAG